MKIDSVHILFWSYSGTTEAFAAHMAADIRARGWEPRLCNLLKDKPDTVSFSQRDLLIMLCPVFAGRLPAHAAVFLKSLSGDRAPALAAVTYGNREYEDALLELCDGLENQGFCLAGAAALVAQHSIFPKAARGRPDEADKMKTSFFLLQILQKFRRAHSSKAENEFQMHPLRSLRKNLPGSRYRSPGSSDHGYGNLHLLHSMHSQLPCPRPEISNARTKSR